MTMTMDEDESVPTNGSLQPQSMICSSTDINNLSSSTTNIASSAVTAATCPTGDIRLAFSQVKGILEDEVADGGLDCINIC